MSAFLLSTLLLSIRLLPLMVVAPIVFFARLPFTVRLLLALSLAAVLASGLTAQALPVLSLPVLVGELLLGVAMAFAFHVAQAGVDMAGRLIDTQIGLNASGVFDPATSHVTSLISELLGLAFALLFVALNVHHDLLRMLAGMLSLIPPGSVSVQVLSAPVAAAMTQQFLMAFMMLSPVILGLWLTDMAFALLSRSMPQANIYFLALPVKLGLGCFALGMTAVLFLWRTDQHRAEKRDLNEVFESFERRIIADLPEGDARKACLYDLHQLKALELSKIKVITISWPFMACWIFYGATCIYFLSEALSTV